MSPDAPDGPFLTERRIAGLLVAAVVATAGYWLVARIELLQLVVFFLIFAAVFAGLNYLVYRYD